MTLVPIIYTSLLILSASLFFVVIVSYISYKAKSRDRVPAHLRHVNPLESQLAIQPSAAHNFRSAQRVQIKTAPYIQSKIQTPNQIKIEGGNDNYIKAVETMKRRSEKNNMYQEDNVKEMRSMINRKENHPAKRIENPQPVSNRLEIMNHSDRFKTRVQDFEYPKKSDIRYSDHGDVNLFTFYSDISDLDFVALSTPQINRAI